MPSAPSIANSVTVRLILPARATAVSEMTGVIEAAGGVVTGLDVTASGATKIRIDLTMLTHDPEHAEAIVEQMREVDGVEIGPVSDRTFLMHLGGKLRVESKVPIRTRDDLSMIYTPGVARICLAIAENPADARRLTIKRNTVAVVTDGTAVLGLGDIGPLAALPVMEGKAALFKRFADIDAFRSAWTPKTPRRSSPPSRRSPRRSPGSTSRTSRPRAASRSRPACARSSTSPSSTTTSTEPPSWRSLRCATRCGSSASGSRTCASS